MDKKQTLGLIGSLVLFVAVFTPIISAPFLGSVTYFQNGKGDGVIVFVMAVISLFLVLAKKYRGLWVTGIITLGMTVYTFIAVQTKMSEMQAQMETQLKGNPFRGIADATMQGIQIQWGWALLIVGAGLLIASAAIKEDGEEKAIQRDQKTYVRDTKTCRYCQETIPSQAVVCQYCRKEQKQAKPI